MSKPQRPDEVRPPETRNEDEAVHVPKGQSRAKFLIILGLMVFTLIVFVVPQEFEALFDRRSTDDTFVSWKRPGGQLRVVSAQDFQTQKYAVSNVMRVLDSGRRSKTLGEDEDIARLMIIDELARESGVDVSDKQVAKAILEGQLMQIGAQFMYAPPFGDQATFENVTTNYGIRPAEFVETLRTLMRVDRFELFLGFALAQPDPTTYDAEWKKAHQEYSFDFVMGDVAVSLLEVEAALPPDAEIKAWYDLLLDKSRRFAAEWRPERMSAELVSWRFDAAAEPTALLAKFPRPEGADLEQLAQDYYNLFGNVRFRRAEEKPDAADDRERLFLPFAEVADAARRESLVHAAFVDWQKSVKDRSAVGEALDLATEAASLGLAYRKEEPAKSQVEWNALENFGGPLLTQKLAVAARGDKAVETFVGDKDIVGGRVLERVLAGAPPFEEVRDKALTEWKQDKAVALAEARIAQLPVLLRAKPPTTEATPATPENEALVVDEATFEAKAKDLGVEVVRTGWFDPTKISATLPAVPTVIDRFQAHLRTSQEYTAAAAGAVIGPKVDTGREFVWLARAAGARDPEVAAIKPMDLEALRAQATQAAELEYREEVISPKAFAKTFELKFADGREIGAKPGDETVAN